MFENFTTRTRRTSASSILMPLVASPTIQFWLFSIRDGSAPLCVIAGHVAVTAIARLYGFLSSMLGAVSMRSLADRRQCRRVLAIMKAGPHRDTLRSIFDEQGWQLTFANTVDEIDHGRHAPFGIVLYQRSLADNWGADVFRLSTLHPRPWVVLISESSDNNLWDALARNGGSDIMRVPFDEHAVVRTIERGWLVYRNHQHVRPSVSVGR
jgi:hypothetical protein